jgi:hypothetical protein
MSSSDSDSSISSEEDVEVEYKFKKENNKSKNNKKFEFAQDTSGNFSTDKQIFGNKLSKGKKHSFKIKIKTINWESNSWGKNNLK